MVFEAQRNKRRWVAHEALKSHSDCADGTLVLWPDGAPPRQLAGSRHGDSLTAFDGSPWLSAVFTVDAGYEAFAVSAFTLVEAQRLHNPRDVRRSVCCCSQAP